MTSRANQPLVTAVMVTGKRRGRVELARGAVRSFLAQTYRAKELVIVNDGYDSVVGDNPPPEIREVRVPRGDKLGVLRNIGLEHANGSWVMQWDDDDWYHEDRILYQMRAALPGNAVLLLRQVRYSFISNSAFAFKWVFNSAPGIPGTILHPNQPGLCYRDEWRAEDEHFLHDHFKNHIVVIKNHRFPHVYLRFYHGGNTWDERHVMGDIGPQQWWLPPEAEQYLKEVLRREYQVR